MCVPESTGKESPSRGWSVYSSGEFEIIRASLGDSSPGQSRAISNDNRTEQNRKEALNP
jgi:hypothetical protein